MSRHLSAGLLVAAMVLVSSGLSALAAPPVAYTWGSTPGNWSHASNWNPNTVPVSSSATIIKFTGSSAFPSTNDLDGDFNLNQLVIDSTYTVAGGSLGSGSAEQSLVFAPNSPDFAAIRMDGSGSFSIDHNLKLVPGGQLMIHVNDGQLRIGNINLNGGHLTLDGTGGSTSALTVGATGGGGGVISDGGSTPGSVTVDSGTSGMIVYFTGASTYSGGTDIKGGTLSLAGGSLGTGPVTVENHATLSGYGSVAGAVTLRSDATLYPFAPFMLFDRLPVPPPVSSQVGFTLGSLTWDGGGHLEENIGSGFLRPTIDGALTKGAAGTYTIDLTDAGVTPGQTYSLLAFGSQSGFTASDFTVTGVAGQLTLTATELLLTTPSDAPTYGVTMAVTKGKNRATFTITNTGSSTTDFRLLQSQQVSNGYTGPSPSRPLKPAKPAFKIVTTLNGANVSGAMAGGAAVTIAPGASAQVVVQLSARRAVLYPRAIRISLSAGSQIDPSKSASATANLVLKAQSSAAQSSATGRE